MNIARTPPKYPQKVEPYHTHPNPKWTKASKTEPKNLMVPGFDCTCKKGKRVNS